MTLPKIPKAGQSKSPLRIHTVTNSQGKTYTYRGREIRFWVTEEELNALEKAYNFVKATKFQGFSYKERETVRKFAKTVLLKYCKIINEKYAK